MTSLWSWNLHKWRSRIWVPIMAYALLGVATALVAWVLKPFVPAGWPARIGADSVSVILQIMASSMLAVTTFSLSIMLSAFSSAASGATPRATELLKSDQVTQGVLATFVGGFIYSLVGIIGLETGIYAAEGRFVLFLVTLVVFAAIVTQLVRWIGHLADYGRLADTISRVEKAASASLQARLDRPWLGGRKLAADPAVLQALPKVHPDWTGYVQMVDMGKLNRIATEAGVDVALAAVPGAFIHPGAALAHILPPGRISPETVVAMRGCFAIDRVRTFDQDPRFGLLALTEIASRALSPAVNDPGTAIDILGRQLRILSAWAEREDHEVIYPAVHVPGLTLADLMDDAFAAIARDGAALIEVQVRFQKTMLAFVQIAPTVFGPAALHQSRRALDLARAALVLPEDRDRLAQLHADVRSTALAAGVI